VLSVPVTDVLDIRLCSVLIGYLAIFTTSSSFLTVEKPDNFTYLLFHLLLISHSVQTDNETWQFLHKVNTLVVKLSLVMTSENNLSAKFWFWFDSENPCPVHH